MADSVLQPSHTHAFPSSHNLPFLAARSIRSGIKSVPHTLEDHFQDFNHEQGKLRASVTKILHREPWKWCRSMTQDTQARLSVQVERPGLGILMFSEKKENHFFKFTFHFYSKIFLTKHRTSFLQRKMTGRPTNHQCRGLAPSEWACRPTELSSSPRQRPQAQECYKGQVFTAGLRVPGFFHTLSYSVFTMAMWEELYLFQFYRGANKGIDPWVNWAQVQQQVAELGFESKLCDSRTWALPSPTWHPDNVKL